MGTLNNFKINARANGGTDIYNSDLCSHVDMVGNEKNEQFKSDLEKWKDFISWARWNGDLFLDLISAKEGGIRLDLDQRVFLRSLVRFAGVYGTFPRGYGKTLIELLALYVTAILYPDITLSMSAQTREASAKLFAEKHREILKFYPLIKNEIVKANISKDTIEIIFTSGAVITNLANAQSSKGLRRHRISVEEAALLNDNLYMDVIEPIPNIPRRTIGKASAVNPEENNGQIHFLTTAYFKNSEYERSLRMVDDMAELKGKIVLGSKKSVASLM